MPSLSSSNFQPQSIKKPTFANAKKNGENSLTTIILMVILLQGSN
jgi:hypothetical protein